MGMTILPWQMVCKTHPLGHQHKDGDKPSLCEIHKKAAQEPGQHLLPPMECEHISDAIDDYDQTPVEKVVPTIQMVAVAAILFDLVSFEIPEQPFQLPPDPNCRSATLLSDSPLRAPPLV